MPQPMPRVVTADNMEKGFALLYKEVIKLVNRLDQYVVEIKLSARAETHAGLRGQMMEDVRQLNRAADRLHRLVLGYKRPTTPRTLNEALDYAKIAYAVLRRDYAIRAISDPSYWDADKMLLGEDDLPQIQARVEKQYNYALQAAKRYLAMIPRIG